MPIAPGLRATLLRSVTLADTAVALGSGDLEVLGTPRLLAWFEEATVLAVAPEIDAGRTSVGTRVDLHHERASPVGASVSVSAEVTHVDGRLLRFAVVAEQSTVVVAHGQVTRVVVDRERLLARL